MNKHSTHTVFSNIWKLHALTEFIVCFFSLYSIFLLIVHYLSAGYERPVTC